MRVAAKMALELLAVRRPALGRRWEELRPARRFVRHGEGVLPVRVEALSKGAGLRRPRGFPVLAHAVEVWTHQRNLHFRVTLFGRLHATGTLATGWQGPRLSLLHAFDPTRPGKHVKLASNRDGPGLGVWHGRLKQETFAEFAKWFERQTRRLSRRVMRRPFKHPPTPDLAELRPLIEAKYEALCKKSGPPKAQRHPRRATWPGRQTSAVRAADREVGPQVTRSTALSSGAKLRTPHREDPC